MRALGEAISTSTARDCYVDPINVRVNGCNDHKPYDHIPERAWTFRTIGYRPRAVWKELLSALRLVGYDYVISIEHGGR